MALSESCCTCATVFSDIPSAADDDDGPSVILETKNEKQVSAPDDRRLGCCSRVICGRCINNNPRFASYCPYCQIASSPSNPLPQGLREPPSYELATGNATSSPVDAKEPVDPAAHADPPPPPPPYRPADEKSKEADPRPPDTLHFVHPTEDTIPSLSLRYNVPAHVLRAHNKLASDHLVPARRTLLIPGSHYPSGVSLRPRPVEGEEEEARKAKIRRWMVACKCVDYEVAELYLGQTGYDLGTAVERFLADEAWEKEHPMEGKGKAKGRKHGGGGIWASQAAFLRRQGPS